MNTPCSVLKPATLQLSVAESNAFKPTTLPSEMPKARDAVAKNFHNGGETFLGAAGGAFRSATRIQESFTARLEQRILLWLTVRLPAWVNSDHLTLLGFAAMFLAGCSYALARWNRFAFLLATVWLAVNWFGDSLDGTLARVRNCQRPRYGFYVDHMIDSFGALFLMAGLGASGYIDWRIAIGMLVAFLLLSIESYLASYTLGVFRLSFARFGPTEIRILLAVGNVVLFFWPEARIPGWSFRLLDFGGLIACAAMIVMVAVTCASHTLTLYRQETSG
jgi:archaetidylinositol phosphate synthase